MFMAFLLRENPINGLSTGLLLGIVIGAAGLGNALGIGLGSLVKRINPAITVVVALAGGAVMSLLAALFYGVLTVACLGLVAGLSQALAKLSLDSTIQAHVPERVQTSAFARSDTVLQMAWVIGGFVGIAMPLIPSLGLGVGAAVLGAWLVLVLASARRPRPAPAADQPRTTTDPRQNRSANADHRQSRAGQFPKRASASAAETGADSASHQSSSSASARRSLATGAAVLWSGAWPRRNPSPIPSSSRIRSSTIGTICSGFFFGVRAAAR